MLNTRLGEATEKVVEVGGLVWPRRLEGAEENEKRRGMGK